MSDELSRLRARIDAIDQEVLRLVSERANCAHTIGTLKKGPIYRPEREAQVLGGVRAANPGPLSDDTVAWIFREIMSACLALEQPLRIAHLGPAGTFTEAAARKHFGNAPSFEAVSTIDDAFRMVLAGHADYTVVPVENSTEGAVGRTLDLMLNSPLKVCGEVMLRVHQNLLGKGESPAGATRVYSHSQSLAQCHEWLNRNLPGVERVPVASNAEAARLAAQEVGALAVAGELAAERFGLNILASNIEDEPNNTTRFLVLGHQDVPPSGRDKTSLVMAAQNKPGAMHALLSPLAYHGVSMTRMESRPSRTGLWEYVFYVDIEGHAQEPRVADALSALNGVAGFLKILGSYPVAQ